jgi:ATP-dependent Clp protease protease subunit
VKARIPSPGIFEETPRGERAMDIWTMLFRERIVFLGTPIVDDVANLIIAQLLYLERDDPDKDVNMYIQSPGGDVSAGLAIYDTMQMIKPDVATISIGTCASMGAWLLAAGAAGKRYSLPHSRILIHQGRAGAGGQITDIEIQAKEYLRQAEIMVEILARHTGQDHEKVRKDIDRDFWMSSEEAKEYGIIDEVLQTSELATAGVGGDGSKG